MGNSFKNLCKSILKEYSLRFKCKNYIHAVSKCLRSPLWKTKYECMHLSVHEKQFNLKCTQKIHLTKFPRLYEFLRIHDFVSFDHLLVEIELSFNLLNKTWNFTWLHALVHLTRLCYHQNIFRKTLGLIKKLLGIYL